MPAKGLRDSMVYQQSTHVFIYWLSHIPPIKDWVIFCTYYTGHQQVGCICTEMRFQLIPSVGIGKRPDGSEQAGAAGVGMSCMRLIRKVEQAGWMSRYLTQPIAFARSVGTSSAPTKSICKSPRNATLCSGYCGSPSPILQRKAQNRVFGQPQI